MEDDEEHQIKSVTFQDTELKLYGPYTSMSSFYDSVNLKTINFNVGEEPPFDEPARRGMEWSYTIDWYPSNEVNILPHIYYLIYPDVHRPGTIWCW